MVIANLVGAGVGVVFSELLKAAKAGVKKEKEFKFLFKRLELKLKQIMPLVVETEELYRQLNRSDDEMRTFTGHLQEGLDLVRKCGNVHWWCEKKTYTKKLDEFDEWLFQWAQINLPVHLLRNRSETLLRLETNRTRGDSEIGYEGEASAGPDFLMGLDEPIGKLKVKLLDGGGEHVVVLSGPEGCGKTTLAKKLCSDDGIKDGLSSS